MAARSFPGLFGGTTAVLLACLGLIGLYQASGQRSLSAPRADQLQPEAKGLASQLARRELTLDLRHESHELMDQFIRAQMASHYWGQFASSLTDLGLASGRLLEARVESDERVTRLWLSSPQGTEAYLASVQRTGGRLDAQRCKGAPTQIGSTYEGRCPDGWSNWSF